MELDPYRAIVKICLTSNISNNPKKTLVCVKFLSLTFNNSYRQM